MFVKASDLAPVPASWDEPLSDYQLYQQSRGLSERTIHGRDQMMRHFARHVDKELSDVTTRDLRLYLGRPISPASRMRTKADFSVFFRWATIDGIIPTDPASQLEPVRPPKRRPRPVTAAQLQAMLSPDPVTHRGATARTRTMIMLAAFQGWRASEIARVRGDMFDLDEGVVRWTGKGDSQREGEIHPLIGEEVLKYPSGSGFPDGARTRATTFTSDPSRIS